MKPNSTKKKDQKLLWRIHHWAGLYTGIIIGVLSLTGALAVFIPEIEFQIQKQYYSASSTMVPGEMPKIERALADTKRKYPEMRSLAINMPEKPGQVAVFTFAVKGKDKASNKSYYLFVDPGRDKVIGSKNHQNSLTNYLRQIHVRLYEGFWGRQLVGLGGIALVIVTVTGLLIYSNFMKKQPYPNIRKGRGLRILLADWHKILGISALLFNFMIACTGAWLGLQPKLMKWFDIKAPNFYELSETMDPKADKETAIKWDEVFNASKKYFPDLIPGYIRPSEDGTGSIAISGTVEGQIYEPNINTLVLSKATLKPLFKYDLRNGSFQDKFYSVQEALHFGNYGGLALKILYTVLGLTSAFLSISGFVVFLYRTEKKQKRKTSALKVTFIYSLLIVIILIVIALISMFVGYSDAAFVAGVLINGGLAAFILYAIVRFFYRKIKFKPVSA